MKAENRDLIISGLAFLLAWYLFPNELILWIGASYLLLCYSLPWCKELNHRFWLHFTKIMQAIMNPILMALIYFLVLTPIAFLYRFSKKEKQAKTTSFHEVDGKGNNFEEGW
jgi:large-conductance mechanosensitive channel